MSKVIRVMSNEKREKIIVSRDDKGKACRLLTVVSFLFTLYSLLLIVTPGYAIKKSKLSLLRRIHTYAITLDTTNMERETYAYARATLRVDRRNPILMLVPSAYVISHGKKRQFLSEGYLKITVKDYNDFETEPLIRITTIPHRRRTMENFSKYLTPTIYSETIIGNTILSPFHPNNFNLYKYRVDVIHGDIVEIRFQGKRKNTQLARGAASIDRLTGRIIKCNFISEFDMTHAWVSMEMGERGYKSLFPQNCEALFHFRFLGNKVSAHYKSNYGLDKLITDSIVDNDPDLMAKVRPDTLSPNEQRIYAQMVSDRIAKERKDSLDSINNVTHKKKWVKTVLWDAIGDNVLNRIRTNFGQNGQGYVRVNPILNPLYMSYSGRRGFTYKFDIRASYQLGDNSEIFGRLKAGYSFKQEQFYFRLPIFYYFDRRRNRYFKLEIGNGNRISNHLITQDMGIENSLDNGSRLLSVETFNEFKTGDGRFVFNYDFDNKFGFQVGVLYQRWRALNPYAFRIFGWEPHYSSFAPIFQFQYRPFGWTGPIFTLDYDRGIKGVANSNTQYERFEFNGEYIHQINRLQSLQMRLGGGLYTNKGRNAYFLNYENFKENNIPGGWNDDWSGEFELLRGETYNTSSYYIRGNLTYESPLLILSWLPWVGHYMEMERIYCSILNAENLHPYMEFGYGFTTRVVSVGLFMSNGKGNRTIGCKFGFELFRHW